MKIYKITVVGNSVALRCRPRVENGKNYGQYLEHMFNHNFPKQLTLVDNTAFSRATVVDVNSILTQQITNKLSDVFIINLGVCEASTREIPYWFSNILNQKNESWLKTILNNLHHHIFKKHISFFVKIRGKRNWINKKKFRRLYENIIFEIKRNSDSKIIILSINLPNERVENILPGSYDKCLEYNTILTDISNKENASYISCDDLISEVHYNDGAHYSDIGHQIVAERIFKAIKED